MKTKFWTIVIELPQGVTQTRYHILPVESTKEEANDWATGRYPHYGIVSVSPTADRVPIISENAEQLEAKLANGVRLATALVDHLEEMGGSSKCIIPVHGRAEEMVVVVMTKLEYDRSREPRA